MKKLKILFISHNIAFTGSFFRGYHWGKELVKMGHDVTLLATSRKNRFKFLKYYRKGVQIIESPDLFWGRLRSGWDPWGLIQRAKFLSNKKYDIIHCIDSRPNTIIPGLYLRRKIKSMLILDWLDWWGRGGIIEHRGISFLEKPFAPIETFFEERFRKYANGNITITNSLRKRALSLGVNSETIILIPFGADVDSVKPMDKEKSRHQYGFNKNDKILGILGTLLECDSDLLFKSYELLMNKMKSLRLIAIGNSHFKIPDRLLNQGKVIQQKNLPFNTMIEYLSLCDYLLLPLKNNIANRGRWPSKISDYLAAGRPIISTRVGDIDMLFKLNNIGYQSADTPKDFSNAIIQAFTSNQNVIQGHNARKLAVNELSWSVLSNQLVNYYYRNIKKTNSQN